LEVVEGQRNEVLPPGSILSLVVIKCGVLFVSQKMENEKMLEILVLLSLEVGSVRLYSDSWKVLCTARLW
jgi:hypothetical protein